MVPLLKQKCAGCNHGERERWIRFFEKQFVRATGVFLISDSSNYSVVGKRNRCRRMQVVTFSCTFFFLYFFLFLTVYYCVPLSCLTLLPFAGRSTSCLSTCSHSVFPLISCRCGSTGGGGAALLGRPSLSHSSSRRGWTEVPCTRLDEGAALRPASLRTRSVPIIPSLQAPPPGGEEDGGEEEEGGEEEGGEALRDGRRPPAAASAADTHSIPTTACTQTPAVSMAMPGGSARSVLSSPAGSKHKTLPGPPAAAAAVPWWQGRVHTARRTAHCGRPRPQRHGPPAPEEGHAGEGRASREHGGAGPESVTGGNRGAWREGPHAS